MQHKWETLDLTDIQIQLIKNRVGLGNSATRAIFKTVGDSKALIRTDEYLAEWQNILDDANTFEENPSASYTPAINPSKTTALTNADFTSEIANDKVWQCAFAWLITGNDIYIIAVYNFFLHYADNSNGLGIDFSNEVRWSNNLDISDGVGHKTFGHFARCMKALDILLMYIRTLNTNLARRNEILITRWAFWLADFCYRRFSKKRMDLIFDDRAKHILNAYGQTLSLYNYENEGVSKVHSQGADTTNGQDRLTNRTLKHPNVCGFFAISLIQRGHYLTPANIGSTASQSFSTQSDITNHLKAMVDEAIQCNVSYIDWAIHESGFGFEKKRSADSGNTEKEQGTNYSLTGFSNSQELSWSLALYNKFGNGLYRFKLPIHRKTNIWTFQKSRAIRSYKQAIYTFCDIYRKIITVKAILNNGGSISEEDIDFYEYSSTEKIFMLFNYKTVMMFWNVDRTFAQYLKDTLLHKWENAPDFEPSTDWVGIGGDYKTANKYVQNGCAFNTLFALLLIHTENSELNPFNFTH